MSSSAEEHQQQQQQPASRDSASSSGNGDQSMLDKFGVRSFVSGAEKKADQLNTQFHGLCNKVTGEKDANAEQEPAKEESLMGRLGDFGTKGYGLVGELGKKFGNK